MLTIIACLFILIGIAFDNSKDLTWVSKVVLISFLTLFFNTVFF